MSYTLDDPPNSRLFIVAGRQTSAEFLRTVFEQYGQVAFVKYLREKGVAYVKYDRASAAALAIENLHEVTLNDGQGPRLKVLLAESPHTRNLPGLHFRRPEEESLMDPDNSPPRSRLFMVVPKNADGSVIEAEMARFTGMQYCKCDLIASKGIIFVKYSTSSSACLAMETVQQTGMVAGYKVKIMLAEPKTRRSELPGFLPGLVGGRGMQQDLVPGLGVPGAFGPGAANATLLSSLTPGLVNTSMGLQDYSGLQPTMSSLGNGFSSMGSFANAGFRVPTPPLDPGSLAAQGNMGASFDVGGGSDFINLGGNFNGLGLGGAMGGMPSGNILGPHGLPAHFQAGLGGPGIGSDGQSKTRLFVVVHKQASDEALARLFQCYPGMEYIDVKKDKLTGRSKGYAYVGYASPDAAAAAQAQLNGIEYPLGTGCRLKVMFAEPLMNRTRSDVELRAGVASGPGSGLGSTDPSSSGGLMATPTRDTAATSFRLPSPASVDSLTHSAYNLNSARTDPGSVSYDTQPSAHSSPLRLASLESGAAAPGGSIEADIAAMQAGLAGMGLGLPDVNSHGSGQQQQITPRSVGWRESSPDSAGVTRVHSTGTSPAVSARRGGDETVVYSALNRPLPEYALTHVFSQCGPVEYVRVLEDQRVAVVKYSNVVGARLAVNTLDGAEVLGETLHVRQSPPPYAKGL